MSGGVRPNRAQRSSKNKLINRGSALGNISQSGMKKSSNIVQTPVSNIIYGIYRESSSQRSLIRNTMQQESEDRQAFEIEKGRFLSNTSNNTKGESLKTATIRLQQQAAEIHRLSFNKSATPVGISNSKGTKPSVRKNSVYNSSTIAAINELAPQNQILQQSGISNLSTMTQNKNGQKQQFQARGPSLGINEKQNMVYNQTQYSQQMQNFLQQQINFSLNPNTNTAISGLVRDNIINNLGIQNNRMTPVMSIKNRSATTTSKGGAILVGSTTGKLNKQNVQNQQSQINYYNSNLINSNETRNTLIDQQFQMQGFQGEGKHHLIQIPQGQGSESHEIYQAGVQSKNHMILQVPSVMKQSTKKLNKKVVNHNQVLVSDRLKNNQKKKDSSQVINQFKERLTSNQRKKGTQTVIGVQKPQGILSSTNQFGTRTQNVSVIGPQTAKVFSTSLPRQARQNEQYIAGINPLNNTYMTQIINNQKSSQQSLKQSQLRRDSDSDNLPNEQYQRIDNEQFPKISQTNGRNIQNIASKDSNNLYQQSYNYLLNRHQIQTNVKDVSPRTQFAIFSPNNRQKQIDFLQYNSNMKEEAQALIAEQALAEMQNALNNQNDNSQIFLNIDDQAVQLSLNHDMLQSPSQFTENQFNDTHNLLNALDETQDFSNKQQDKKYSYPIKGGLESSSIKIEDEAQNIQQSNQKDKSIQHINQKVKQQNISYLPQQDDQWNRNIDMQASLYQTQNSANNLLIQEQTSTAKFKNKEKQKLATLNEDEIDKEQFLKIVNNAFYKIISSLNPRIGSSLHQIQQMYTHFIEQVEQNHYQELQLNAIQILSLQNEVQTLNNKLDAIMSEQVQSIQSSQIQKSSKIVQKKNGPSVQKEQITFQNNKMNLKRIENTEQRISYVDTDKSQAYNIQKSLADKLSINEQRSNDIYIVDPLNLDGDILVENIAQYQNSGRKRIISEIGKSEDRRGGNDAMVFYDNQREPKVFKLSKQALMISQLPQDDNPFDNDRCESRLGHREAKQNTHNQKIYIENDEKNRSRRGFDDSTSRVDESVYDELLNEGLVLNNYSKNMIQIEDNAMEFEDEEGGVNSISRQKQITAGMPNHRQSDMQSSSSLDSSMLLAYAKIKQNTHKKQKSVVPELDLGKLHSQMEIERIQEIDQHDLINAEINEEFFNMEFMDPENDCNKTIVEGQYVDHQASSQDYGSKSIDDSSRSEDMIDMLNQLAGGLPTKPQGIPKLGLKMPLNIGQVQKEYVNENEDFQDEFMGKYNEFSESWRQAIQRQKRF